MPGPAPTGYSGQRRLIEALLDPGLYPHAVKAVQLVETHISWVLLAGRYAYKIKKALNLGFLDFTQLQSRRFYCEEEIRLNRRLAPQLYLDVIAITGSSRQPRLGINGDAPAIEYAVRMRRFAAARQMDHQLARGLVLPYHMDRLAVVMAQFHAGLPPAAPDSAYGEPAKIYLPAAQNFAQLATLLEKTDGAWLSRLQAACELEYAACVSWFEQRRQQGKVRECHGDLHLGNIVLLKDQPTPFDGIEFDPELRWIDVMNEIAFLVMDLSQRNRADLAFRFLNGYLETSGDYAGMRVLRFYLAYRATVRAKICAIRARQPELPQQRAQAELAACRGYLRLAEDSLKNRRPALILMHGLPGCGKTTVAQVALERLQAIRIRSDVERKRLFGLTPLQASYSGVGSGIYDADATQRTYDKLHELARALLEAGYTVIVDASFNRRSDRARFQQLANTMALPFVILNVSASPATLRRRIQQRVLQGSDASEADLAVYQALQAAHEPLQREEQTAVADVENDSESAELGGNMPVWRKLDTLLASA
jgi:hypothetical protein